MQRYAWGGIALIVLCAALGLFGRGLFSQTTMQDPSLPISVTYERFVRYLNTSSVQVHIDKIPMQAETVRVWLSKDYLNHLEVQPIFPTPEWAETSSTGITYVFRVVPSKEGIDVVMTFQMQAIGFVTGRIGVDESHALTFRQWVYP